MKQKRPRMGRPPGPPEKVRRHKIATTFTEAERAELERRADAAGLPVGTVIHQIVKRALARRRP